MILFLDFDGVLHPHPVYNIPGRGIVLKTVELPEEFDHLDLFCYAHHLVEIMAEFPAVRIVLSTSWVEAIGYSRTVGRLPAEIRRRVVGATYHSRHTPEWNRQTRYQQIRQHVDYHGLGDTEWIALDDNDDGWPADCRGQLVYCDDVSGIAEARARDELRAALGHRA